MKKVLAVVLASVLALSLVACASKQEKAEAAVEKAVEAEAAAEEAAEKAVEAVAEAAEDLRTVKFCLTRSAEVLEDTPFWAAQNCGYLAEEGLTIEMIETYGTTDCKMVATGQADFAVPGPSLILQSIDEGLPIKVVEAYDAINIWGLCVLNDSPYQTFADIAGAQEKYGRKLTVALGDASWESLVTPTLIAAGINPAEDLEFVVAGDNRFVQVAEGNLDILFSWPGEAYQLIGQNYDFKYLDGNEVLQTNSNSIITNLDHIENDPELVTKFTRALAKGIYFCKLNPEAAAAVSCDQWPNIDVTWKAAVYVQSGRVYQMFGPDGGADEAKILDKIGYNWEDKWLLNVDVMYDAGIISRKLTCDEIFTNDLLDLNWDKKEVEDDAANYDWKTTAARYPAE